MSAALHPVVTLAICVVAARFLIRAKWVRRAPGSGIALWQMLAATWVLSLAGMLITLGLAPYDAPVLQALPEWSSDSLSTVAQDVLVVSGLAVLAVLAAALVTSWCAVARIRRRHRDVLALVGRTDDAAPGALVVDHPAAVAYCLPGTPSSVVLSTGALRSLTTAELHAVLAHEHSHARERHDLVLLPFVALRRCAPRAADAVALLVEMRADDRACRDHSPEVLASALHRFTAGPPAGALGTMATSARVERINSQAGTTTWHRWTALLSGLSLVATSLSFLVC
ncbi:M56 family metallopeptidase [Lentzea albidocapillata]|uniref:Peptidase family M48 n=1 Tax=Lentzea albidocapillata TaxID=40571 RepID=A0A1W2FTE8_9PSEU|nr:M56 family metallopeptidase [Lentzea albidocapillata]SMD25247.1 Peptidase family M48 [Lentzea albidocapillata]